MKQCFLSSVPALLSKLWCFWGRFWGGGRIIALALLRFAKYGVVKRLGLGDFDGWLIVTCSTTAKRDEADDRLKI